MKSKWIKVKDRTPRKDMEVITSSTIIEVSPWGMQRNKTVDKDFWHNKDKRFCLYERDYIIRRWFCVIFKCRNVITHWQPLPKHATEGK